MERVPKNVKYQPKNNFVIHFYVKISNKTSLIEICNFEYLVFQFANFSTVLSTTCSKKIGIFKFLSARDNYTFIPNM